MLSGIREVCKNNVLESRKFGITKDYDSYTMSFREKAMYISFATAVIYLAGFIFYRSHILSLLICPIALFYPKIKTKEIIEARKKELNLQFKDLLYSLSSSLSAGKSVETAFKEVLGDLQILYPDTEMEIIKEAGYIVKKLEMNETVESALEDLSKRTKVDDIENFADVFQTCKRNGGNLVEVIKNTSNIISDKIEIQQDIDTILAQRKFERRVLNMLPIFMIIILSFSAYDYINPVFNTISGRIAMSASILFIAAAYLISKGIMDIKI